MESGALGEHVLTHSPAFNFLCFLGTLILFSGKLPAVTNLFLNKPNPGSGEARQGLSHSLPRSHHTSGWPPGSGPEPRPGLGLPHPKRPLILGPRVTLLLHRCLVPTRECHTLGLQSSQDAERACLSKARKSIWHGAGCQLMFVE